VTREHVLEMSPAWIELTLREAEQARLEESMDRLQSAAFGAGASQGKEGHRSYEKQLKQLAKGLATLCGR